MVQNQDFSNLFVPWIDTEVNTENITIQNDNSTIDDSQEPASVEDTNDGYKSANSSINEEIISEQNQSISTTRKSTRKRQPPKRFDDYVLYTTLNPDDAEPQTWQEAMNSNYKDLWKEAMNQEINSLEKNKVWSLQDLPPGKKPISLKWVFKTKKKDDGSIDRFKARLVARGFLQQPGQDYTATYAPVVRMTTIRFLLCLAVKYNFDIYHFDVETAFLYSDLDEDIYVIQPEPFVNTKEPHKVLKLHNAIYGLKQG